MAQAKTTRKRTTPTKSALPKTPFNLVVVESPAKAKTIGKFLGNGYLILASNGHIVDLPKSKIGIDIENSYEPQYIIIRGKNAIVKDLQNAAKFADKIFLATDPDREGEAISWHIARLLGDDAARAVRIQFNEITKSAVSGAIDNPREINVNLVDAQQARRVLDRLVGYKLSPFLWHKVKTGLSAGRVQSVAVRIICDREKEILQFVPVEYWTLTATLFNAGKTETFDARYHGENGKKKDVGDEHTAMAIAADAKAAPFVVSAVNKAQKKRHPSPPFTTSLLQQEASRKLGFTTSRTMMIAQQLYEGVEIASMGHVGLVTYIRTDSTRISSEAITAVRSYIAQTHGGKYVPEKPNFYKSRKGAQDAHEAIRPSYIELDPAQLKDKLSAEQYKLYKLIYERFVASQMVDAVFDTVSVDLSNMSHTYKASCSAVKFKGYLAVYDNTGEGETQDEDALKAKLPELTVGDSCTLKSLSPEQHFTQPPARYTEAGLVRALEEKGIGRPSTYAPIISTIQDRGYIKKESKRFMPTDLGMIVNELMMGSFNDIVNVEFTAELENKLDDIENDGKNWRKVIDDFYKPFDQDLEIAEKTVKRIQLPVVESDVVCDKCGAKMVYKEGRFGQFLACPNYPECKNTKPIRKTVGVKCPKCGGEIIEKRSKKSTFYGCENYPNCDFVSWNKPINERCATCGSLMELARMTSGKSYKRCSNPECPTAKTRKKKDAGEKAADTGEQKD